MKDPKAAAIITEYNRLKSDRANYETTWADIRKLVRPNTSDFRSKETPGLVRTDQIYDGTAMQANIELANAVQAFLFNPGDRNFGIKATAQFAEVNNDPEAKQWMDDVADIIASEYLDDRTMFTGAFQEACLDIAFGTTILNQEWDKDSLHLVFRAIPLSEVCLDEGASGTFDRVYRCIEMTVRQIREKFPDATWEGMDRDENHKCYHVIHAVKPRSDRNPAMEDRANMPFSSTWVLHEKQEILEEGGYTSFPYHIGRWSKASDEMYGRGPAVNCLPDIRMLNRMEFTIIKAAMKAVDPVLIMPSDGFLSSFKSEPGSVNYKDPSANDFEVQTLEHRGNFPVGEEKVEQKREFIRRCFYADWVRLMPKKERQTAYEVAELVDQQLRIFSPMLGRLMSEQLIPCLERSYNLLSRARMLPPVPQSLDGVTVEIDYDSAASRAQKAARGTTYIRLFQNLAVFQPLAPDVTDALDTDYIAQDMATMMGVPARGVRSPDDIASIRKARAEEQQAASMVEAAPKIGKTALDLSKANQAGGLL